MSEVIDAQVVDVEAKAADPFADLMSTPPKAEIIETKEDDLSPEEREQVNRFMSQIDITDSQLVLQYGAAAQKNVADFPKEL